MDAKIFALVHDSILAEVKTELVPEYTKVLKQITQRDRGFSIPGAPIGVDVELGEDYSFLEESELLEKYPTLANAV